MARADNALGATPRHSTMSRCAYKTTFRLEREAAPQALVQGLGEPTNPFCCEAPQAWRLTQENREKQNALWGQRSQAGARTAAHSPVRCSVEGGGNLPPRFNEL